VTGRPFLTATWHDVLAATYAVDDDVLAPHVPPGCALDHLDGAARVSLVAFRFSGTRVLGMAVPGHRAFPEVNLRFYVRRRGERGVVFLRELVPRRAVALAARWLYAEPYVRTDMAVETVRRGDEREIVHRFGAGRTSTLRGVVDVATAVPPAEGTPEHWLTHHHLGLGTDRRGRLQTYEVRHPLWALAPVRRLDVAVDFERVYGSGWAFLGAQRPSHATFALGSAITVSPASGPALGGRVAR
jgi:uncharacterized protein